MLIQQTQALDVDLLEGEQALRRIRPELDALVPPFTTRAIHVPYCVSILLGVQPTIDRVLPLMKRYTPLANASRIANLRDHALATAFVHHRSRPKPPGRDPNYSRLVEDAHASRRRLVVAAAHLADLGLLDRDRVAEIRGGRGHLGVGDGLLALATLFEEHWAMVSDSTPIERQELHHAADLGASLLAAVTERRQQRLRRAVAVQPDGLHRRAVHAMVDVYEEARRVVAYIGWYESELSPLPSLVRRRTMNQSPFDGVHSMAAADVGGVDPRRGLLAAE